MAQEKCAHDDDRRHLVHDDAHVQAASTLENVMGRSNIVALILVDPSKQRLRGHGGKFRVA
jgi:hypothetical protein